MPQGPDPSKVRFVGPLAPFAPGLVTELASLGYTNGSATAQTRLAASLSRWMAAAGVRLGGLTEPVLDAYLAWRRSRYSNFYSRRSLAPALAHLRRVGALPEPVVAPAASASRCETLLALFAAYLAGQRAVSPPVVRSYVRFARPFAEQVLFPGGVDRVRQLSPVDVAVFVTTSVPELSVKSAQMTMVALRSLLRFLHAEALTDRPLATAVPPFPSRRLGGLPRPLPAGQAAQILAACDTASAAGRRDRAVITLMCRLGLRCAEVAALCLDDLDWLAGTVIVHGKNGRIDSMPLPVDAGEALVAYLRAGRPATSQRAVFVRLNAPFTALGRSSVSMIVGRAARRAGLGTVHGHRLRHTVATETLGAGASLDEVAQLLRHDGLGSTIIYAKTDQTRLAQLAHPWPAGTAGAR
jgi:site-specific recombinase XerD